jgi:uncharacterized protein YfdQ (DUF2303 family)
MVMDLRSEIDSAFLRLMEMNARTLEVEGVPHVVVPDGCRLQSLESLNPAPQRIKASPAFANVDGFVDYVGEFAREGSRIFVDKKHWRFTTVFDAHAPGQPSWCDHSASLTMELSHEWKQLLSVNGKKMAPQELAEYIEENLEYFIGPVEGAELLTMAQNLKLDLKGDLNIATSTQSGLRELIIRDDSVVKGQSGEKTMAFPEKVELAMRIFDHDSTYKVTAYLRYRASKDGIVFWFKIVNPDDIQEGAFDKIVSLVREQTALKTLYGTFDGPKHK